MKQDTKKTTGHSKGVETKIPTLAWIRAKRKIMREINPKSSELPTMAELRAERDRVELLARQHALEMALAYYFAGALDPEADVVRSRDWFTFPGILRPDELLERTGVTVPEESPNALGAFSLNS